MKSLFIKVILITVLIAALAAALGGCFYIGNPLDEFYDDGCGGYFTGTDVRESVSEGYFKLTIDTSKDEFDKGETIDCWTELEYIGNNDSITVYVMGEPVTVSMTGKDICYDSTSYVYMGAQKELTLKKGSPVRYTLSDLLPKSKSVLPGQYEIDATANLSLSPDGLVSYYGTVSAVIVVKE